MEITAEIIKAIGPLRDDVKDCLIYLMCNHKCECFVKGEEIHVSYEGETFSIKGLTLIEIMDKTWKR